MIATRRFSLKDLEIREDLEESLGTHIILELYECNHETLTRRRDIESVLREAATAAGLTVLVIRSHEFHPQGLTSMAMVSESHLSVHTWPEHGFAAADVFVCTEGAWKAAQVIADRFNPERVEVLEISRGNKARMAPTENRNK
jgi:S-adenosylmethionine decarboxylase